MKMSKEFKREPRYVVFKIKDALDHLSACELDRLQEIGEKIAAGRSADDKPPFNAVVVEQDWPEFDVAWQMIQDRVEGRPSEIARLTAELAEARADTHRALNERDAYMAAGGSDGCTHRR